MSFGFVRAAQVGCNLRTRDTIDSRQVDGEGRSAVRLVRHRNVPAALAHDTENGG